MWVRRRRRRYQELFNSAALATNALAQLDEVRAQLGDLASRVDELAGRVDELEAERSESYCQDWPADRREVPCRKCGGMGWLRVGDTISGGVVLIQHSKCPDCNPAPTDDRDQS